jgi:rRNA-processing protein EBP2
MTDSLWGAVEVMLMGSLAASVMQISRRGRDAKFGFGGGADRRSKSNTRESTEDDGFSGGGRGRGGARGGRGAARGGGRGGASRGGSKRPGRGKRMAGK